MTFLLIGFPLAVLAQEEELRPINDLNPAQREDQLINKDITIEGDKPPITDYLIISQDRDTTFVDTTLSLKKEYKFNYLRQDNFERLAFHNVGQPYNHLGRNFDFDLLSPRMGARARHNNYIEIEDVYDYYVPTPLTELYFKTVVNQGQQLDALFTSNLSPEFNFSIGYKGVRSAGDYINTLTSSGNFKFTANYVSKNGKYRLRAHTTFQDHLNQENGGLTSQSLENFRADLEDFSNRARLEPNLETAQSNLDGRRFYIHHDYELVGHRDSTSYYSGRIYNQAFYEDKYYRFTEDRPTNSFLGESYVNNGIRDKTDFEEGAIEVGAVFDHHLLGYYKAGIARRKYNYGYNRIIDQGTNVITNRLIGELYQFKAGFAKQIGKFDVSAQGGLNLAGELDGQFLKGKASYDFPLFQLAAGISVSSRAPDFNYQLFQSDYVNYNWQNSFSNVEKQELKFEMKSEKLLDVELSLTTLQDHVYFSENLITDNDGEITGYTARPFQADDDIAYLKIKAHREFKFLKYFGLDNSIMYQNLTQGSDIINLPQLTTRNTLYYKNRFFQKALLLQAGITARYFTEYSMDGYDPVLGEFYTQNSEELGGFPLIDLFINAKVRQTRIFFKLEHANQLVASNSDYFSAPRNPYRDFTIRFGLVWNFFL
ncbi:putative porin [Nonlabens xiamenensis]|uniref:putative porin n=1 Tax=Nonlabens xiamenensis TaxID=2341043 RepID=UPI000F611B05|nr:putative porin [Nonlabens xiamenensis]